MIASTVPGSAGFDLAVVGGGIVGLAHALAAARRGLRVVVIDRDAQPSGASIRNFGFVTVTGQQHGACWERAMRSRDIWVEVAAAAGVEIVHRGLVVSVRRPEALAVLAAFQRTAIGEACELLGRSAAVRFPWLNASGLLGALYSPHEVRVQSRQAIPRLGRWLAEVHGVTFWHETVVREVSPPLLETTRGLVSASGCIVCPGDDFMTLFPERLAAYGLTRCKLQMLRLAAPTRSTRLGVSVMSDLGLVRYLGYAALPEARALRERLALEQKEQLAHGVHLIVVQDADGTLIVGDSHHYAATPDPFASAFIDELILEEFNAVMDIGTPKVVERWIGTYASASDRLMLVDRPSDAVRLVVITSGTGASTAFAIGEEVVAELFGGSRA